MSPKKQDLNPSDIEGLSVKNLVKWVQQQVPNSIPDADEKIMQKGSITGYVLLNYLSEEELRKEGLSLGTRCTLLDLKKKVLSNKKRTSEQADISEPSASETKKVHFQEGSGETTDSQKSTERKAREIAEFVEAARRKAPLLSLIATLCTQRHEEILHHFRSTFKNSEDAKKQLSSPIFSMELPFPFLGFTIPKRFSRGGKCDAYYHYMGREVFSRLVDEFKRCTQGRTLADLWVYGLMGFGKSHLLATLVYFLTAQGYRVVYLPDCRLCYQNPVRYLQESLLFTWADKPEKIGAIINFRAMDDVEEFLLQNWESSVVFVVDQMNALDGPDESQVKAKVRTWLNRCRLDTKSILSTSANNSTFLNTLHQQNNNNVFTVCGGFTTAEMAAWWSCHDNVDLGEYSRAEVEDLTGKIPLLLDGCTTKGVLDLGCQEIEDVVRQSRRFAHRMQSSFQDIVTPYQAYVKACITESVTPKGVLLELVDHPYFHEKEDGHGYCACGIARDEVTKGLAQTGIRLFSIEDCIRAMTHLISNASVVGYFLENAILQTVTSQGIACLDLVGPTPQIVFDHYPLYDLKKAHVLYVPKAFNFPAIAALILLLDHSKMKAELIPMQITIAKSHSNSEDLFFKNWDHWTQDLGDYEISLTFLWITFDEKYSKKTIEARYRESRGVMEKLVIPAYSSVKIPLKEVNEKVWRKYQDAKNKYENLGGCNVTRSLY